jgi:hypothetical protein
LQSLKLPVLEPVLGAGRPLSQNLPGLPALFLLADCRPACPQLPGHLGLTIALLQHPAAFQSPLFHLFLSLGLLVLHTKTLQQGPYQV